jgi:hypothetical protein
MEPHFNLLSFIFFNCDQQDIINVYVYSQNYEKYQKSQIQPLILLNLDIKKYKKCKDNDIDCSICCDKVKKAEFIRELNCNHIFHKKCIDNWLKYCIKNNEYINCPLCRTTVERIKN